jgi:uncharacterized membrane protein
MAAIGALVVMAVPGLLPLRIAFALPLLLVLPGYSLTAALFPGREIDWPPRLLLSVALSLSLAVVIGLALNQTPFGLRSASWSVALLVVTWAACATAVSRRRRKGILEPVPRFLRGGVAWTHLKPRDVAFLLIATCVLGSAVAFARTPLSAKKVQGYTALSLLPGSRGTSTVRVGVTSGELHSTSYRLVVRVGSRVVYMRRLLRLDPGAQFHVRLRTAASARPVPIEALLYRQDSPQSIYRVVRLWPPKRIAAS